VVCAPIAAALVLHRADLPPGFRTGTAVASRLAGGSAGCRVVYSRATTAAGLQEGPLQIQSAAVRYPSAAAARTAFARTPAPRGTARLALDYRIGAQARQYVSENESGFGQLLEYWLVWREGAVEASLLVIGRVGVVSAADLAPLARAQERRIAGRRRASTRAPRPP